MEQIIYYTGLVFFSVLVGLLGIFYRNILKMPNMIFARLYGLFELMVNRGGFFRFIAYPLGYCIYCATTWIAIIGFLVVYRRLSIEVLIPIAISHYIVMYFCKHYSNLEGFNAPKKPLTDKQISNELGMSRHDYALFKEYMKRLKQ